MVFAQGQIPCHTSLMNQRLFKSLLTLFICCATTFAVQARAYDYNYRAFVGGDLQRSFFEGKDYRPVYLFTTLTDFTVSLGTIQISNGQLQNYDDGFSIYAGYNLYNFGFQFGYTRLNTIVYPYYESGQVLGQRFYAKQKGDNIFLDLIYYFQFSKTQVIRMLVGVGALRTNLDFFFNSLEPITAGRDYTFKVKNTRIGPRVGIGWQYNLNRCWSTDISYKYQMGNAMYQYMQTISIALSYYFL